MLKKMQISGGIDEESMSKMTTSAWIWGILFLGICVFVAIALKKGTTIGIIAGVVNAITIILTPTMIKAFHEMEFFKTIYGTQDQLDDLVEEYYAEQIPKMIAYYGVTILGLAAFVLALVFIIKSMKCTPKVFPIFALIIQIVRYAFIAPIDSFKMFTGGVTVESQISQANLYYIFTIIPIVLLVVPAIINLVKKPAPVAQSVETPVVVATAVEVSSDAAPAVEVSAGEAPVDEAPTDENTEA